MSPAPELLTYAGVPELLSFGLGLLLIGLFVGVCAVIARAALS